MRIELTTNIRFTISVKDTRHFQKIQFVFNFRKMKTVINTITNICYFTLLTLTFYTIFECTLAERKFISSI